MSLQAQPPSFTIPPAAEPQPNGSARPLWAVWVVAVLSGAYFLVRGVTPAAREAPTVTAAGVVAFGAFAAVCAWILNAINRFRKPGVRSEVLAFLWGGLAAAGYALLANTAINAYVTANNTEASWSLFAPFTEEPAKNLGVVIVLLVAGTQPRTALDGLVAGSFVGLGFEVTESIGRALNNAVASYPPGQRDNLGSLATDVVHEVVRNSWTGHIVITGVAGFGIGYLMTARDRPALERWAVAGGLATVALAGHLLWNTRLFGPFFVVGQFALLAVFLWLVSVGRKLEAEVYNPYLAYAAPELVGTATNKAGRRAVAELAAAIANGDAQRAHRAVQALG